jgi:alpha-L-fucosidase
MQRYWVALLAMILCLQVNVNHTTAQSTVSEETLDWWHEAKFGMFIHFGLYSIPAGVWEGELMSRNWYAEWIRMQHRWPEPGGIPKEEYDTLLSQFNPTEFDADAWIREAHNAGMRYFLITSKHHDGFALWPSKVSDYNVVEATPFKRDILGELAAACRKYDVKLGFYYSHWQDWEHPGGAQPPWPDRRGLGPTVTQPTQEAFEQYWQDKCLPQVRELIENYDPAFFWFDSFGKSTLLTERRLDELIGLVRRLSPDCLINSRIGTQMHSQGNAVVDFHSMGDNQFPKERIDQPWETSGTMNRSWGYHRLDFNWKAVSQFLKYLVDNTSRGGNYQLNVGPMSNGVFPKPAIRRLRQIGAWLDVNGEAIYDAKPVNLSEPVWGRLTAKETSDGYRLYLHVYAWPKSGELLLNGLTTMPAVASVLETTESIKVSTSAVGLHIKIPELKPDANISVLMLEYKTRPSELN